MKIKLLTLSVGAALSVSSYASVVISEYVEGGKLNKAIEVANTGDTAVNLAEYQLATRVNGKGDLTKHYTFPAVELKPGQVFVLAHKDAAAEIKAKANITGEAIINHNGDETYALLKNGALVDYLGTDGDVNWGKDKTLQRSDFTPTLGQTFEESKWTKHAKDSHADLGLLNGSDAGTPDGGETPDPLTTIMELQGESWKSPFTDPASGKYTSDKVFTVQGVITAIQTSTSVEQDLPVGFFIQDENGDNNPRTSDAIFVKGDISGLSTGQIVKAKGKVTEDYGWTQLLAESVKATGNGTVQPTELRPLSTDKSFDFTLERHEGMLVTLSKASDLKVTRSFSFDSGPERANMVVAHKRINVHPNQNHLPGSDKAINQHNCNEDARLVIESFEKAAAGAIPWYPDFAAQSATPAKDGSTISEDYIRIGDTVDGLQGVLGYSHSDYRLYVTNTASKQTFIHSDPRSDAPHSKAKGLRIATFNVLNYFNSPFGGDANTTGKNRGAQTQADFDHQSDKIVSALLAMDADIFGLMEIENNGFGENSAVAHLVAKLNAKLPLAKQYAFVSGDSDGNGQADTHIGSGAVANQVLFRPAKLTLANYKVITMPEQRGEGYPTSQRDALTPTFTINGSEQNLTVSVNHFKSKGGECIEDKEAGNDNDMQGACENLRISAAAHLAGELEKIDGYKLILGDLNSYASEGALQVLTQVPEGHTLTPAKQTYIGDNAMDSDTPAAISKGFGYRNLIREKSPQAYSYEYKGNVGTLDYILADQATAAKVSDALDWNINAAESALFEYSQSGELPKYHDAYRSSDHNPALVVLTLNGSVNPPKLVTPPTKPVKPPKDIKEKPERPRAGKPMRVLMDLTTLGDFDLHVGDIASLNFSRTSSYKAAMAGDITSSVTLTEAIIQQGWVELSAQVSKAGDYEMSKVIQGATGDVYQSNSFDVSVEETTDEITADTKNSSGGSASLFSLLTLAGLSMLRRRKSFRANSRG